jgi:putative pyruvate formate lyase activating enzyme
MTAVYRTLYESGELAGRISKAFEILKCCTLCPRQCRVDRLSGALGICKTGAQALVSDFAPHFGEEQPLVGKNGSGTIFFSRCNLLCLFCQNYDISHLGDGTPVTDRQLADIMLSLQKQGCPNINFVTPTHVVPQILAALRLATEGGLKLPLVYNCSGYESIETLELLDGIIDIYMPDFKFWSSESAARYAKAPDYPEQACASLMEMHRQVGDLVLDDRGLARHGVLIRHLVMPGGLEETEGILRFIAQKISPKSYINVMDQYRPCGRAADHPPLDRPLFAREYRQALEIAGREGLTRLDKRDIPDLLQRLYAAKNRE